MSKHYRLTHPPKPPKTPRAVEVFLKYLKAEGVEYVFGIPGGLIHPLFDQVELDDTLKLVMTKHEQGAAFMADGFARVSGKMAVCATTAGPGATNALTAVACAYADGVPMIVVTGQVPTRAFGKGAAQETAREDMDIVAMFNPITKYSAMVSTPQSMAPHLRRALRLALSGRPGPVHLNIPVDIWEHQVEEDWFEPNTYRTKTNLFDRRSVQRAAEHLIAAEYPVILAGSGVSIAGAEDHLLSLAEMLPARVATTPRAKGVFPEDHHLSLGVVGLAGHLEAREAIFGNQTDVLLTVGASLNETTTMNWLPNLRPRRALIQIDIDADRVGRNYPVDVPLVGDALTIMMELVYHLHRGIRESRPPAAAWSNMISVQSGQVTYSNEHLRRSEQPPLKPQKWRTELEGVLPEDAIIFSDIGGHMLFNVHHLSIKEGQKFVLNLGFGSMGHGTVAPIGAALAMPHRQVVTIVGDGCFHMNGMELLTAREENIPVIWLVENNNMHGITWFGSQTVGAKRALEAAKYKQQVDIAAIARAMGLNAWTVDSPGQLQSVFNEASARREPAVIEIRVDLDIPPPIGDRAKAIAGFIDK